MQTTPRIFDAMTMDFPKIYENGILRESFAPVIIISLLCHALFFTGIIFLSRAIYKSKEFDRPHTFDLIKLSQIFEAPAEPSQAALPKLKATRPKTAAPTPAVAQPAPVAEQNPVPSEQKTAAPAAAETPSAPQAASGAPGPATGAPVSTDNVYEEGTVDELPVLIKSTKPFFPEFLIEGRISGIVKGWTVIDKDGTILQVKINSSPHEFLSEEVTKSIARWKYKPAKFKGVPVKMKKYFEIKFELPAEE
jgi:outer membrane biosynthesis protein TonB